MRFRKRSVDLEKIGGMSKLMGSALTWLLTPGNAWANNDYVTASDLEQRLRGLVEEMVEGEPRGSRGQVFGGWGGYRLVGLNGISLLHHCRHFLFLQVSAGRLEHHNFGRGHISGARFRVAGTGPSPTEKKTIANRSKEKPVHYCMDDQIGGWAPWCTITRRLKSRTLGRKRSNAHTTKDADKVTCPTCCKALDNGKVAAGRPVTVVMKTEKRPADSKRIYGEHASPAYTARWIAIKDVETGFALHRVYYKTLRHHGEETKNRTQAQARQLVADYAAKRGLNILVEEPVA